MRSLSLSRMTDADNDAKTDILLPLFEMRAVQKKTWASGVLADG
jgi:hypothetical protein